MSRFYTFHINGNVEVMTLFEASQRTEPEIISRVGQIKESNANKKRVKDGFEPGWQENIQAYCGDRKQYNDALRERGLVEIGKDYVPQDSTASGTYCRSEEFAQAIMEQGVELSGNEVEAIKSGEYFKED
jgi:hypothetical protein